MSSDRLPQQQTRGQYHGSRPQILLGVAVLAALAIRLLYLWGQMRNNPMFEYPMLDALQHHTWAQMIASGQGLGDAAYYRAPLYYHLLGLLYAVVGPSVIAGRLMGCLIGTLSCYLIGKLASTLAGHRAGIVAAFMAAIYWPFVYFDAELLTVGLEICLNTLTLLLLIQAGRRRTLTWFLAAGAALGLAVITRPNILAFVPFIGVWCLLITPTQAGRWRFAMSRTAAVCLAAAVFMLPVTIRNYRVSGEFVLVASTSGINFYIGNNPEADGVSAQLPGIEGRWGGEPEEPKQLAQREAGRHLTDTEVSKFYFARSFEWIRQNPGTWAMLLLKKLRCFWIPYELSNNQSILFFAEMSPISSVFWLGFPVAATLAGGALFAVRRRWRLWFPLIMFGLVHMATTIVFFCPARYRLPIAPVLIVFAGAGVSAALRHLGRHRSAQLKSYLCACGGCALMMAGGALGGDKTRQGDAADGHYRLGTFFAGQAETAAHGANLDKAIAEFRAAIDMNYRGPSARLALAHALMESNKRAEAEIEYRAAARDNPENFAAIRGLGEFLAVQGRDAEAALQFRKALKISPLSAEAHQELGCLLVRQGDFQQAGEHLREAIRLDSTLMRARFCLSQSFVRQRDYPAAIAVFQDILAMHPDQPAALLGMGNIQINSGKPEDAIDTLERARKSQPNLPGLSFSYATALRVTGRRSAAVEALESQLRATPDDPQCLALLAWILATAEEDKLRNGHKAAALANRAITLASPPSPEALDAQAAAFAELGRFEDAARVARAAIKAAEQAHRPALMRKITNRARMYANGERYRE